MSHVIILGFSAACTLAGWVYFDRWQITRPPIGVVNLWDIAITFGLIVLMPLLYIALPDWAALALLALGIFGIVYQVFEPILHRQWVIWLVALVLVGGNVLLSHFGGTQITAYLVVNNLTLVVAVLGLANLWAQGGMKARDAAILALLLAVYDVIFTSQLTVMGDLFNRLGHLPFAPMIVWGSPGNIEAIGLGDLLMATLFPLVMCKAYGQTAGIVAQLAAIVTIGLILLFAPAGTLFPVMAVLSPVIVFQYIFWRWQRGIEHTTRQYRTQQYLAPSNKL